MKWIQEKDKLEELILKGKTYEEIGKLYNCSGGNIRKTAKRLNIDLPQRRKINPKETFNKGTAKKGKCKNCGKEFILYESKFNKYCCHKCQHEYEHNQLYQKLISGDPSIMRANYSPKIFKEDILKEQNGVCAICGITPKWNNKDLVFILDHIDGHASNNKRDNLRCICPNCDSQLDTYKSKNKNGDRIYHKFYHR